MPPFDDSKRPSAEGDSPIKTGEIDFTQLRAQIDAIDDEIIELILKRIDLANQIMKTKFPSQIIDSSREEEIALRYFDKLSSVSTLKKSKRLALGIVGASKLYPDI